MAVTVITARDPSGKHLAKETYAEATSYTITQWGLDVADVANNRTVGSYAPGSWVSVYLDDAVQLTVETPY